MKYYLIAGEASGDLHASHLMRALKEHDHEASFRFFGGDLMAAEGGTLVKHYRELAYMGFVPVLLHLPAIFRNMRRCKRDIEAWRPDAVILVDYPGFNLSIARHVHRLARRQAAWPVKVYYYISPKIWAWKEWRIKAIRRDVDELFSILPFEKAFFEDKHHYPIHYVGNPTADEVNRFRATYDQSREDFCRSNGLHPGRPIVALLAGSRQQEIKDNLSAMLSVAARLDGYQLAVAGAPSIPASFYAPFLEGSNAVLLHDQTYPLLSHATAALVTSGTATLETALFDVPQAVCYKTPLPRLIRFCFNHFIKVPYISLVNLIADREVVPELMADRFTPALIAQALESLLPGRPERETMLDDYKDVRARLGSEPAPDNAARTMVTLLRGGKA